jgi:hypothetical protein
MIIIIIIILQVNDYCLNLMINICLPDIGPTLEFLMAPMALRRHVPSVLRD